MTDVKIIDFGADRLLAYAEDEQAFVAIRPICASMGLDWSSQRKRIKRDPILSEGVVMMTTPFGHHGQEMAFLRLDLLNGWLFGVDSRRVSAATRPTVQRYQRECYRVLHEHFYRVRSVGGDGDPARAMNGDSARLRQVIVARRTWGVRAAQQMWLKLGLPIVPAMVAQPAQPGLWDRLDAEQGTLAGSDSTGPDGEGRR